MKLMLVKWQRRWFWILNDDEIIPSVQDEKGIEQNVNEFYKNDPGLSNKEAVECLETTIKCLER